MNKYVGRLQASISIILGNLWQILESGVFVFAFSGSPGS